MKEIKTTLAPSAIGPYSQAIESKNGFVFVSGQLPINYLTNELVANTIENQTKQSLENVKNILNSINLELDNVVKTTVLLSDIKNFQGMNEVYNEFFNSPYPARAAYEVANLPKGALVEIEVIAEK